MNTVVIEGYITNVWTYSGDTLFRLAHDGNYVTVRFQKLPLDVKSGMTVVVSGKLVSRDQRLHLEEFVERALNGDELSEDGQELVDQLKGHLGYMNQGIVEVMADEIRSLK